MKLFDDRDPGPWSRLRHPFRTFLHDESGATALEYGVLVAVLTVSLIAAITAIGVNVGGVMNQISNALSKS